MWTSSNENSLCVAVVFGVLKNSEKQHNSI